MTVIHGYIIVAGLFDICKNTETQLKFIDVYHTLHTYITVLTNERNLSFFMQNFETKLPKNTTIYRKKP